jgi:hypothetical protein
VGHIEGIYELRKENGDNWAGGMYLGEAALRMFGATTTVMKAIKYIPPKLATPVANGHWNIWDDWEGTVRGKAIHKLWGANLPFGFPVIDDIDRATGVITSMKSVNLADKTYQKASQLRNLLKVYLNDLVEFKGRTYDGVTVTRSEIKSQSSNYGFTVARRRDIRFIIVMRTIASLVSGLRS